MSNGPGKYDQLATIVRTQCEAEGVVIIVRNGFAGCGFSVQGTLEFVERIPEELEFMAKEIRRQRDA